MKRLTTLTLSLLMLFAFCSCSSNQTFEKYCWNCGEGITKDASFCEHCGATIKNQNDNSTTSENISTSNSESTEDITPDIEDGEQSENSNASSEEQPTESSEDASSSTPEESNVSEKSTEPETPTHTHSYSKKVTSPTCTEQGYTTYMCSCGDSYKSDIITAKGHNYSSKTTSPTCTEQGYTTYTCSCGDTYKSDYVNASHDYSNYKCTKCGIIDKTHAYEYLIVWVKENGSTNGGYTEFNYKTSTSSYSLSYSAQYNNLSVQRSGYYGDSYTFTSLHLDTCFYGTIFDNIEMCGYISPQSFTSNTAISYQRYNGDSSTKPYMAELARANICDLIDWLDWCLGANDIGITIKDLGFTSY